MNFVGVHTLVLACSARPCFLRQLARLRYLQLSLTLHQAHRPLPQACSAASECFSPTVCRRSKVLGLCDVSSNFQTVQGVSTTHKSSKVYELTLARSANRNPKLAQTWCSIPSRCWRPQRCIIMFLSPRADRAVPWDTNKTHSPSVLHLCYTTTQLNLSMYRVQNRRPRKLN